MTFYQMFANHLGRLIFLNLQIIWICCDSSLSSLGHDFLGESIEDVAQTNHHIGTQGPEQPHSQGGGWLLSDGHEKACAKLLVEKVLSLSACAMCALRLTSFHKAVSV